MVDFINEVQENLEEDIGDNIINIAVNSVLESLIDLGILKELDMSIGYNGITKVEGVSNKALEDSIQDKMEEKLGELI